MKKKSGIDPIWFTLGCLIGFTAAALIIVGLKLSVNFNVLKNYQDIIGSILALVAAASTVWVVLRQIQQSRDLEYERRECSNTAARAVLPLALRDIGNYAQSCVTSLIPFYEATPNRRRYQSFERPPNWKPEGYQLAGETVSILRDNVLSAPAEIGKHISILIRAFQYQDADMNRGYSDMVAEGNNLMRADRLEKLMSGALEIDALVDKLFPYACGQTASITATSREDLLAAAHRCSRDKWQRSVIQEELHKVIQRMCGKEHVWLTRP